MVQDFIPNESTVESNSKKNWTKLIIFGESIIQISLKNLPQLPYIFEINLMALKGDEKEK